MCEAQLVLGGGVELEGGQELAVDVVFESEHEEYGWKRREPEERVELVLQADRWINTGGGEILCSASGGRVCVGEGIRT